MEVVVILQPILHNQLTLKEGMQAVEHIMAAIAEIQVAVHIVQKETDLRKPVTLALLVMVLVASSEMTVPSQVTVIVAI